MAVVALCIAAALVFGVYPLFQKAEKSPKIMYILLFSFVGVMAAYLCFVMLYPFPEEVYAVDAVQNLISARKNGFTLLGCAVGMALVYTVDLKWLHFETKAVWWAQVIKAVGGLAVVLAVKELLRAPLDALFGWEMTARCARYFLMVVAGGILWPMTFRFFSRLGKK